MLAVLLSSNLAIDSLTCEPYLITPHPQLRLPSCGRQRGGRDPAAGSGRHLGTGRPSRCAHLGGPEGALAACVTCSLAAMTMMLYRCGGHADQSSFSSCTALCCLRGVHCPAYAGGAIEWRCRAGRLRRDAQGALVCTAYHLCKAVLGPGLGLRCLRCLPLTVWGPGSARLHRPAMHLAHNLKAQQCIMTSFQCASRCSPDQTGLEAAALSGGRSASSRRSGAASELGALRLLRFPCDSNVTSIPFPLLTAPRQRRANSTARRGSRSGPEARPSRGQQRSQVCSSLTARQGGAERRSALAFCFRALFAGLRRPLMRAAALSLPWA